LEGLLTVVVAFSAYLFVHNYPATARFLKDDERKFVLIRLKDDSDATEDESFSWHNVKQALRDPKVYLYCFGFHTMSLPLYTLSLFLPSIIKSLGYTSAQAQLLSTPPYVVAFITTMSIAILSERYKRRAPFIIGSSSFAIIGYILLLTDYRPGPSYLGCIFAAAGIYPAVALTLAWPAQNVSGQTKRAVANGLQISIGNLGAILGTQLYRTETAPHYRLGHLFALGYLVGNIVVTSTQWYVLKRANDEKERRQATEGIKDGPFIGDDDIGWRFTK
jgi:MFS family permease